MASTETALREWRTGQTQSERLAAAILRLEQYRNIEPQAPIGGADDGADILCERGTRSWVAAVYFPHTEKEFSAVEAKFRSDLKKAKNFKRHGMVFLTNQRLTRAHRQTLIDIALASDQECVVYDVERIRGVLDSPEGYGLRAAYLAIPMSLEDQIAFFAQRENGLNDALANNTEHLRVVAEQLERVRVGQKFVAHSIDILASSQGLKVEPLKAFDVLAVGEVTAAAGEMFVTQNMTPRLMLTVHRLVCFDLPSRMIGHFRTEPVYLMKAALAPNEPTFTPPPPEQVLPLVEALCFTWSKRLLESKSPGDNIFAVAESFHSLFKIHPFLDGNGRVARALLMLQAVELFGHIDMGLLDRGVQFYAALQLADGGDLTQLCDLIRTALGLGAT